MVFFSAGSQGVITIVVLPGVLVVQVKMRRRVLLLLMLLLVTTSGRRRIGLLVDGHLVGHTSRGDGLSGVGIVRPAARIKGLRRSETRIQGLLEAKTASVTSVLWNV